MNRKRSQTTDPPDEHPEDRAIRLDSEAYAREHAEEFGRQYALELLALVTTYADENAGEQLFALRESFWLREWDKREKRGRR